jgi:uncharacterized membrane protein YgcG
MTQQDSDGISDLASLRDGLAPPDRFPSETPARSLSDWAVDALIPLMIFCMMFSVTLFLLSIRFVFTENLDINMRFFAFFFVMGIVALNRVKAERGAGGAAGYMGGLIIAVGVFTIAAEVRGGGIAGGYLGNVIISLCFNICVVVILWRITDRLTRDCCVDATSRYAEEGILRSSWSKEKTPPPLPNAEDKNEPEDPLKAAASRPPRRHPAHSLFYLALPIMALLALGQRILPQGGSFLESAGSFYVGIYTAAMLMLLLLSSYRGLRVYCHAKKITFPTHIAAFWLGLGTFMVVLVLVLGLWGPVPVSPEAGQQLARTYGAGGRSVSDQWDYQEHQRNDASGDSTPSEGENGQPGEGDGEGGSEHDPDAAEGPHEGGEQGADGEGSSGGESGEDSKGGQHGESGGSEGGESEDTGQQEEDSSSQGENSESQSNTPPRTQVPMNQMMSEFPALKWLGYGALVIVGLFVLYMLFQAAAHFFGNAARRRSRFAGLFERLERLFRRMTYVPKRKPRGAKMRIDHDIATCARFQNPVDGPLPLREKIQYSYDALCALAYDLGVPREEDQTPFEFLEQLPEPIIDIKKEAHVLTHLFVASSYSTLTIPESVLDDLRAFWRRFERMRAKVVR